MHVLMLLPQVESIKDGFAFVTLKPGFVRLFCLDGSGGVVTVVGATTSVVLLCTRFGYWNG